jgi:hypothetical protein
VIGRIIYASKAHARWQNRSLVSPDRTGSSTKLITLCYLALPSRQGPAAHIVDGVVIAAPGRVVPLAHLLRRQITHRRVAYVPQTRAAITHKTVPEVLAALKKFTTLQVERLPRSAARL